MEPKKTSPNLKMPSLNRYKTAALALTEESLAMIQEAELPKQERPAIWKLLVMLVLAVALLYFAFRGCDLEKIAEYIKQVDPTYFVLVFFSSLVSHVIRAVRWVVLLKPVADRNVSLWHSFYAIILGYAVNVVVPRGGEVVRLVQLSRLEKLPWAGVMPTMLIDRLIDIAVLAFLLGLTLTVLPASVLQSLPWLVPSGVCMLIAAAIGLILLPKLSWFFRKILSIGLIARMLPEKIASAVDTKMSEFDKGSKCLSDPIAYPLIAVLSVLMWFFYWLNFYLMLYAFNLQGRVGPIDCLVAFTVGTVGVLVPTPGSAGGFHLLVQQGLMLTSGLDKEQALAFAAVLHVNNFIITTCVPAAICMLIQSLRQKSRI